MPVALSAQKLPDGRSLSGAWLLSWKPSGGRVAIKPLPAEVVLSGTGSGPTGGAQFHFDVYLPSQAKAKEWFIQCPRIGLEMKCKFRQRGGSHTVAGVPCEPPPVLLDGEMRIVPGQKLKMVGEYKITMRPTPRVHDPNNECGGWEPLDSTNTPAVVAFELTKLGATDVADGAPRDAMP
jgi:hypothetical protein